MTPTNNNTPTKRVLSQLVPLAVGEAVVALLVCLGFGLADLLGVYNFDYRIVSGAALGAVVIIINYLLLTLSVDREIKRFVEKRGTIQMSEEEADKFAKENSASIQNAIKSSFILRTASIMGALILAFLLDWFNPLATAIPMFAMRPVLMGIELIKSKINYKAPNPDNFVKYDFDDENKNEEESD